MRAEELDFCSEAEIRKLEGETASALDYFCSLQGNACKGTED